MPTTKYVYANYKILIYTLHNTHTHTTQYPFTHYTILIWLIFTRTVTSLEIFRWFPQIVFILLTCVRPINVRFSNRFFVYQIKGFSVLLSKNFLKKINLRVRFLPLKIAFFEGFENDNILSSKSYTVTKSGISPQRKRGS